MFKKLLIIIMLLPLVEILLLIQAGKALGFWPTVLLLCFSGLLGAAVVRSRGIIYYRLRRELAQGQAPGLTMLDGLLVLLGGVLLIIPGFLTDLAGLLLLFPSSRRLAREMLVSWLWRAAERQDVWFFIRR